MSRETEKIPGAVAAVDVIELSINENVKFKRFQLDETPKLVKYKQIDLNNFFFYFTISTK